MGKDEKYGWTVLRKYNHIMGQKHRQEPKERRLRMREVTDWTFTWPKHTDLEDCDEKLDNLDLPRLGNNWIDVEDSAVTLYVDRTYKSVLFEHRNINAKHITRIIISD